MLQKYYLFPSHVPSDALFFIFMRFSTGSARSAHGPKQDVHTSALRRKIYGFIGIFPTYPPKFHAPSGQGHHCRT